MTYSNTSSSSHPEQAAVQASQMLVNARQYDLAETKLREHLATAPDDLQARSILVTALLAQGRSRRL